MRVSIKRWLKLLSVAGPMGGCCLTSPCQGCASAVAQEPVKPASASAPAKVTSEVGIVANVNGDVIRLDQVDAVLKRRPLFTTPLSASQVRTLREQVLESMIDDLLFRQFLRKHGRKVESTELEQHLAAIKESLRRQNKLFSDYLRDIGQTETDIRDSITSMLQFNSHVEQRATEAELKKFYDANKDYFDNVQVKVSHVVVRVSPSAPPGERASAQEKLIKIRSDIAEGKVTFAEAARKYSVCASAPKGGDLGFITRRDSLVDDSVAELAFSLKVNQMGGPVASDLGYHLVYVTDRTAGTPTTFEKVQDWVRESFSEGLRQNIIDDLRKRATVQVMLPK